ncbi:putative DnaJ domain-containing protein [Helianthus annuus]|nr:putative DnaJ domain-containing protein [Helianthus annuus]
MLTIDCGWKKGCTDAELKNAYKKLSLMEPRLLFCIRKLKHVEEAKNKFQAIQEAYSDICVNNGDHHAYHFFVALGWLIEYMSFQSHDMQRGPGDKDGVIVLDLLKKFYWQESHCYRIQENNRYAKEEQEHGIKNQLKSTGKKVIASNLHSDLTNEKVAQSQSDGFDSTPIKSTTIQEVPALLSVKSKPKSKPVKDSVQSRSHSNPKERSTSLGIQGKKRLSLPSNGKGVGSSNSKVSQPTKAN